MSKKTEKKEGKAEKIVLPAEMFACLDAKSENYIVEIELPGVDKKNIELGMHDDLVSVKAERPDQMFFGHLRFPLKVYPKKAKANFKQGLLTVMVPVKEKRGPHVGVKIR